MKPKPVNFEKFVSKFMNNENEQFNYNDSSIQIYPLSIANKFIKAPIPIFRADYNFLLLFLNGGGEQQVDYDFYKLKTNDVLFIREGHLNAIKSINPFTEGYYIHMDSLVLNQIFTDKSTLNLFSFNPKNSTKPEDMEFCCKICELLLQQNINVAAPLIRISLLKAIVLKLAETWTNTSKKTNRQSEITMNFKELLYENFIKKREIKFYAHSLAVSENYLNRSVSNATNKTPKQHINELIINHSKLLLQDFSKDIGEIAYELNFADPSYFGRLFKQITGLTPSDYRKTLLPDLSE